ENLPRGEYTARFDPGAFMPLPTGHAALRVFTVVPGRDPIRMDVEFTPLGRLTGRVLDTDGRPLAGANVQVFHANNRSGYVASTGKNGEFEVRSLVPGKYTLMATSGAPVSPEDGDLKTWAPTYFPNRLERQDAEPILVRGGAELSGYDIRMRAVPVQK